MEARVSDGTGRRKRPVQPGLAGREAPAGDARPAARLAWRYGFTVKSYDLDGGGATADFAPVYPATEDLTPKRIRELVSAALDLAGGQWDPLPAALRLDERLPSRSDALRALHQPSSLAEAETGRRRLAFDELLVFQLGLARRRAGRDAKRPCAPSPASSPPVTGRCSHSRSPRAKSARSPRSTPTSRGRNRWSGCCRATSARVRRWSPLRAARAAEAGFRGALMAPTETSSPSSTHDRALCRELGASVGLLTSSVLARERATALEAISSGRMR